MGKKKKGIFRRFLLGCAALVFLAGAACLFYAFMVYEDTPDKQPERINLVEEFSTSVQPAASQGAGTLALSGGTYFDFGEEYRTGQVQGINCSETIHTYALSDGRSVRAITASPPAYLESLLGSEWEPQRITGFVIEDLSAVYYKSSAGSLIAARDEDAVYIIQVLGDDPEGQTVYTLGVTAQISHP